jgi:hypothetical protein
MKNRLDFFRQQMAAFEGSANPFKAIENGYYVPQPGKSVSDRIADRIALRPASTHLLLGGIGSGKTTQLLKILDRIDSFPEKTYVRYIDVSLSTDIAKITPGVLVAIIGITLANLMADSEENKIKNDIEAVRKIAYGYSETKESNQIVESIFKKQRYDYESINLPMGVSPIDLALGRSQIKKVEHHYPGILSPVSKQKSNTLTNAVQNLYFATKKKHEHVVFLLDGLDRLDNSKAFSSMILNDMREISAIGISCVVVGSIKILHEEYRDILEQAVDYLDYQSCWDVANDNNARTFFELVLSNRAAKDFITSDARESIIRYSGGILRDLINITQSSIEEAYLLGDDNITLIHVDKAVQTFGSAKLLGLTKSDIAILQEFANGRSLPPSSDDEIKMLITRRIVEYVHPERRCAIHPALLPILSLARA